MDPQNPSTVLGPSGQGFRVQGPDWAVEVLCFKAGLATPEVGFKVKGLEFKV